MYVYSKSIKNTYLINLNLMTDLFEKKVHFGNIDNNYLLVNS